MDDGWTTVGKKNKSNNKDSTKIVKNVDQVDIVEKETEVKYRRIDSLAMLAKFQDVRGAACLTIDALYLANNDEISNKSFQDLTQYLQSINSKIVSFVQNTEQQNNLPVTKSKEQYQSIVQNIKNEITELSANFIKAQQYNIKGNSKVLARATKKVTDAVMLANIFPNSEKAFDTNIIKAIQENKIYSLPFEQGSNSNENSDKPIHAEMKILQELLKQNIIQSLKPEENIYIGITKRCCPNCSAVIKAVNSVFRNSIREVVYEDKIRIRSIGHEQQYGSGIPKFLDNGEHANFNLTVAQQNEIKKNILKNMGSQYKNLRQAFQNDISQDYSNVRERQNYSRSASSSPILTRAIDDYAENITNLSQVSENEKPKSVVVFDKQITVEAMSDEKEIQNASLLIHPTRSTIRKAIKDLGETINTNINDVQTYFSYKIDKKILNKDSKEEKVKPNYEKPKLAIEDKSFKDLKDLIDNLGTEDIKMLEAIKGDIKKEFIKMNNKISSNIPELPRNKNNKGIEI